MEQSRSMPPPEAVTLSRVLPTPLPTVWKFLTQGELLREWFADCEGIGGGGEFRFDFGDGDFFAAEMIEQDPPHLLRMSWTFMGLGRPHEVAYSLTPHVEGTELIVRDHGPRSAAEAADIKEGWNDFLMRLEQRLRTGRNTRYRWTPEIAISIELSPDFHVAQTLTNDAFWSSAFPAAQVDLHKVEGSSQNNFCQYRVHFREQRWGQVPTEALLTLHENPG
jgi:uncharacterized protein YndB with AHSA1/START domain